MFEAIRSKLVGAWKDLRERGLVTLFFFELVVVTLGVMLAQGVANWASEREELSAMEEARARADLEMGDAAEVGQLWTAMSPCLVEEIDTILRAAAVGEAVDPALLRRPDVFISTVMPLSEQNKLLIRDRYGDDAAYNYDRMQRLTVRLDTKAEEIIDLWGQFALLDRKLGEVGAADRHSVRETAAAIRANLDSIENIADGIVGMAKRMQLQPRILGEDSRLAKNCDDYRSFGRDFAEDLFPEEN